MACVYFSVLLSSTTRFSCLGSGQKGKRPGQAVALRHLLIPVLSCSAAGCLEMPALQEAVQVQGGTELSHHGRTRQQGKGRPLRALASVSEQHNVSRSRSAVYSGFSSDLRKLLCWCQSEEIPFPSLICRLGLMQACTRWRGLCCPITAAGAYPREGDKCPRTSRRPPAAKLPLGKQCRSNQLQYIGAQESIGLGPTSFSKRVAVTSGCANDVNSFGFHP